MLFQLIVAIIFSFLIKKYLEYGFDFWLKLVVFLMNIFLVLLILEKLVTLMNIFSKKEKRRNALFRINGFY